MKTDPVCGMEVHESEAPTSEYDGVTYFFVRRQDDPKQWIIEAALGKAA